MKSKIMSVLILTILALTTNLAFAAGGVVKGPNVEAADRYVYYPGTVENFT